jgi:soluble lytic murein transglycosylase
MLKQWEDKKNFLIEQLSQNKKRVWGSAAAIAAVAIGGALLLAPRGIEWLEARDRTAKIELFELERRQSNQVTALVALPQPERLEKLKAIAANPVPSLDRSRAKYLLAMNLLEKFEGGPAVRALEGLERDYPVMAPMILLKRGRGYELSNEPTKAKDQWQTILAQYPDSPVVPAALVKLNTLDPQYGQQAIADYPHAPATHNLLRQKLEKDPNNFEWMRLLVKYDPSHPNSQTLRDNLVKDHAAHLKPEDWQAIADGYWERGDYKKASAAYAKAPEDPQNLYRLARSLQLQPPTDDTQKSAAQAAYRHLIQAHPSAPETAQALNRLADLVPPREAIALLDQLAAKFPDKAPDALLKKADLLTKGGKTEEAEQTLKTLLKQHPKSDAVAEYRWQQAQTLQQEGNLLQAWQWAQPITTDNAESPLAPKAAFWVGKWANQLGRSADAKAAFDHLLKKYPQSYYAWRTAVFLGWNVGDFNSVRFQSPAIATPNARPIPPAGSPMFQELYQIGQDPEAIATFRTETGTQTELDVNQQFTEALLLLAQGENLQGINQVWSLNQAEKPEDRLQWEDLRQSPIYWHALFPFPYNDLIVKWSQKRQLNPLLSTALIRQESRFERKIKSPVGATGLMQVMPATGKMVASAIGLPKFSLTDPNDNINLGTWYLDYTHREFSNNSLLAVASYNAGPGNVSQWVQRYQTTDPDLFVEKIPFKETKGYIETVFGNYWNYMRIYNPELAQTLSKYADQPNLVTAPVP